VLERANYEESNNKTHLSIITKLLLILLHQIHLISSEHSIAYPLEKGGYQIISLYPPQIGRRLYTLDLVRHVQHGSKEHQQILQTIYTYNDFVELEEGDIVVDCGAYVGGFSMAVADIASHVIAIEPTESNHNILKYNLSPHKNITVVEKAAWKESTQLELNLSYAGNENSILSPDNYATGDSFTVEADTIPNIVRSCGYNSIDFLKIEAEGVEPEILEAALKSDIPIRKIGVDAGPERNQSDCIDEVIAILRDNGYEYKQKYEQDGWESQIVFGKIEYDY